MTGQCRGQGKNKDIEMRMRKERDRKGMKGNNLRL